MPDQPAAGGLKAVIFDVDGTLYRQPPLRRAMALRLLAAHAFKPLQGLRTLKMISAYRHAQEALRDQPAASDLAQLQLEHAAKATGFAAAAIAACVEQWMERAPLEILGSYIQPGVAALIDELRARGLKLAVLSDYPAEPKLRALGLEGKFDLILCAQSREVSVFKPHPRGLLLALEKLGLRPEDALYIGDRAEVDAAAAAAAKMPCAILTSSQPGPGQPAAGFTPFARFSDLRDPILSRSFTS